MGQFTAGRHDHHGKMAYKWRIARLSASIAFAALVIAPSIAFAQESVSYSIPAGSLDRGLTRFGAASGIQVLYSSSVANGLNTAGISGQLSPEAALNRLLANTGLTYRFTGPKSVTISNPAQTSEAVTVEGATPLQTITAQGGENAWGHVDGIVASRSATGTKTDTPLIEVPQSISVITSDEVKARGAETIKEAVNYTAGVHVGGSSASTRNFDNIEIRGFAPTPLYLDGTYLPYIGDLGGSPQIDPYMLERIEVLKGPSSVLYGQNYPGGMINMVSKRPTDKPFNEVVVGTGTDGRAYGAYDFSGPVANNDAFLYRLTGVATRTETNIDYTKDERFMIAPSFTLKPDEDTTFTFLSHYQKDNGVPDYQPLPYIGTVEAGPYGRIDRDLFTGEPAYNSYDREQAILGYEFKHQFNDVWSIRHNAKYISVDDSYRTFFSGGYVETGGVVDYTKMRRNAIDYSSDNQVFATDTNLQAEFSTGEIAHTAIVGTDYKWFRNDYTGRYGFGNTPLDVFNPDYGSYKEPTVGARWDNKISQLGFYAQDQIKWDNWILTLGGRYDWAWQTDNDMLTSTVGRKTDTAFTGRAGLIYLFDNGFAPYASYSTSFMPYSGFDGQNNPFKPTTGEQWEVGVKYEPVGYDALITVSAFDLKQQNVPTYDSLTFVPSQRGEIHVQGVEIEGKATVFDSLDLIAAASYTDSVYSKSDDGTQGNKVRFMPPVNVSLWAKYRLEDGPLDGLGFGAGVRHSSSGYGNDANSFKYPAYTVVDAAVSYDFGKRNPNLEGLELNVTAQNLFDKTYVNGCSNINSCFYGKPRSVYANLSFQW
ncbi:TonB-dependent siderophore receptor [Rhizobium sp. LjRoot98]|uniref:TonB-dependent siderophore receptor n=1 Tax=Rhizobium sp. LjRoot98 TaxID=3342345 RepID=UPI003ECC6E58